MAHVNPSSVVKSKSRNIKDLLSEQSYVIPDYQRDYVWKKDQVQQLWRDVFDHYKKNTESDEINTEPEAYFLGAMVVLGDDDEKESEVVDGQQRLITFTCMAAILLSSIQRMKLKERPSLRGVRQNLENMISSFVGDEFDTHVKLSDEETNIFFKKNLIEHTSSEDRERYWKECDDDGTLKKNLPADSLRTTFLVSDRMLTCFLEEVGEEKRQQRIETLAKIFYECLVVLRITATSHSMAYSLFESLNFRGMPLTQADLIKNELLKKVPAGAHQEVVDNWNNAKEIVADVEIIDLPEFLYFSYISRNEHSSASSLFSKVKGMLSAGVSSSEYSKNLLDDAETLEIIYKGSGSWSERTRKMLHDVNHTLKIKMLYPALVAGAQVYSEDSKAFEAYVEKCMNFGFRFFKVMDATVAQMSRVCSQIASDTRSGKSIDEVFSTARQEASDSMFFEAFKDYRVSNSKMGYFVVYYLEKSLMAGSGALPLGQSAEQHLEHIVPRQPKRSSWDEMCDFKERDPQEFRALVWRIGNLLALPAPINQSVKNESIDVKIHGCKGNGYLSTGLVMPGQVANYLNKEGMWDKDSIVNRQADLAEVALNAWKI